MSSEPSLGYNLIHRVNLGDSLTRTAARTPEAWALVQAEPDLYHGAGAR